MKALDGVRRAFSLFAGFVALMLLVPGPIVAIIWAGSAGLLDWVRDPSAVPTIEGALLWSAIWFVGGWVMLLTVWGGAVAAMALAGWLDPD